jgi:hypothetical protein
MVRFGIPGGNVNPTAYTDNRLANVPVVHGPRRPTTTDKKYPMDCEWRVNKNATSPAEEGEIWKLVKFESNGDATWKRFDFSGESPGIEDIRDQVDTQVTPSSSGFVDIDGSVVANAANPSGIPFETVASAGTNTLLAQIQIGSAVTPTPADTNSAGLVCANENHFTIDATSAMISLKGGGTTPAVQSFDVDANTAPGTDPVVADATGKTTVAGAVVAAHSVPIETRSRAANAYNIEVQYSSATTGSTAASSGLAHFDDTAFAVDADGYVTLVGGGPAALTLTGDDSTAVGPDGSGNIDILGSLVATGTNSQALYVNGDAGNNKLELEIQKSTTASSADATLNGVAHFDSSSHTVDSDGFVCSNAPPNDFRTGYVIDDHFSFAAIGTAAVPTFIGSEAGRPGVVKLNGSAGNGAQVALSRGDTGILPVPLGTGPIYYKAWLKQEAFATAGDEFYVGFPNDNAVNPTGAFDFIGLYAVQGTANWHAITDDGTQTSTDTGIAVDTSWHKFEVKINSDATSVEFYIDDVLEATHTTNIPSGPVTCGAWWGTSTAIHFFSDTAEFQINPTGDRA